MVVWLVVFTVSLGLVIARLSGREAFFGNPAGFIFLLLLLVSLHGLAMGVSLWRRVRDRGWNVSLLSFAVGSSEMPDLFIGGSRVISRSDWDTIPLCDNERPEIENLTQCLRLARGWDEEMERDRRLVTVYTADHSELAEFVRGVLRGEGFAVHIEEISPSSAYGVRLGSRVMVTARWEAEAREAVNELFDRK